MLHVILWIALGLSPVEHSCGDSVSSCLLNDDVRSSFGEIANTTSTYQASANYMLADPATAGLVGLAVAKFTNAAISAQRYFQLESCARTFCMDYDMNTAGDPKQQI